MSSPPSTLKIGCRNSILALAQAEDVKSQLLSSTSFTASSNTSIKISTLVVQGDADKTSPFLQIGNKSGASDAAKSLWTTELEDALKGGEMDVLIHCLKDLPTVLPEGCVLGPVPEREDPSDALCVKPGLGFRNLGELPKGSVVGTSSIRRKALLMHSYPGLIVKQCRGNIDTRLRKLDDPKGDFTAIIIASAGLNRINLSHRITQRLTGPEFPYAVGQAALGVEIRKGDSVIAAAIECLDHKPSRWTCLAERALLRTLQGGCSSPIAVTSKFEAGNEGEARSGTVSLDAQLIHPLGTGKICASFSGHVSNDETAENVGKEAAKKMMENGAGDMLHDVKQLAHAAASQG